MIGHLYTTSIGSQAQTAAKTLIEIAAPADAVVLVERLSIKQTSFDTSENLGTKVARIDTTGTGTATTPEPFQVGNPAAGSTVKTDHTIEPTYTSGAVLVERGFNLLAGFHWFVRSDDDYIVISPSGLLGLAIDVAPTGSTSMHYALSYREVGG